MFGTFCMKYLYIKTSRQMCQRVPSYSTLITPRHSPLLHGHVTLRCVVCVKEEVSWVLCSWPQSADDVQRVGEDLLDAPYSFTLRHLSSLVEEFPPLCHLTSEKQEQQIHNQYYVLNYCLWTCNTQCIYKFKIYNFKIKSVWMKITVFWTTKPCSWPMFWRTCCHHLQGSKGSDSWWTPHCSHSWEGSSPDTAVSPSMPTMNSCYKQHHLSACVQTLTYCKLFYTWQPHTMQIYSLP